MFGIATFVRNANALQGIRCSDSRQLLVRHFDTPSMEMPCTYLANELRLNRVGATGIGHSRPGEVLA